MCLLRLLRGWRRQSGVGPSCLSTRRPTERADMNPNPPRFSTTDLLEVAQLVAEAWASGADGDWHAPAGTLEWDCHKTADHAISHVMVPAWVLSSGRTDRMPDLGEG